jgi:cell division protein YceG involved in septum cleavage
MKQINHQMTMNDKRQPSFSRRKQYGRRKKRLYIVNRPKFILMTVLTLILLSTLITYFTGFFMSEATTNQAKIIVEIVKGDTLWDIASNYNYYNEDIRKVVHRIKTYNQLDDGKLFAGQSIVIPLSKDF